jgi:hypothetical protein
MESFFEQLSKTLGINLDPRMIRSEMLEMLDSELALRVAAGALSGANNAMVMATDDPTDARQRSIAQGKVHLARGWMELHDRLLAQELRADIQEDLGAETLNYRTVQSTSSGNGSAPVS